MNFKLLFIISFTSLVVLNNTHLSAQFILEKKSNLVSERNIYVHEKTGIKYSDLVTIKFNERIIYLERGKENADLSNFKRNLEKKCFMKIRKKYGKFKIVKLVPSSVSEDTLVLNKRTGNRVSIPDWSQVFQLRFEKLVPIDSIIVKLELLSSVEYAEESFHAYTMMEPNDVKYNSYGRWAFENIQADKAWDLTTGDSSIVIAIIDKFGKTNENIIHEDLIGKVDRHFAKFGGHGRCVAGIAGANTNNKIGVASLGWNLHLRYYDMTYPVVAILNAIEDEVDVINFSWGSRANLSQIRDAVKTALANGIVCVAAAGNNNYTIPYPLYPAANNFGKLGQVIAVSATQWNGNEETFIDGWNYSPGNDPNIDPTTSFIDVAAPGRNIETLEENCCTKYTSSCGTSLSAPFVSALVGLLLSIDNTLTPNDIYSIITSTTDKIGKYPYSKDGWNKYLGYGRINSFNALEAVKLLTIESEFIHREVSKINILEQNYPNPFNPSTTIKYEVPEQVLNDMNTVTLSGVEEFLVTLKIFDILAREVITLINKKQKLGYYEVEWNAVNQPSGVYFCQLTAGDFVETKKMILLK